MTQTKHDYQLLMHEFITSDLSVRALCAKHEIANHSTVSQQAKKHGWLAEREKYRASLTEHTIEAYAKRRAELMIELHESTIKAALALIYKLSENLKSPDYIVTPDQFIKIAQHVQLMSGGPTSREEVNGTLLTADLPLELLRQLQAAARANGAGAKPVGQSALPIASGPRKVN